MSNLSERFTRLVHERAVELYGEPLPKIVSARIEEELEYIAEDEADKMILTVIDVFEEIGITTEDITVIGNSAGSYIAYLLGLNGLINPLPPHYYCAHCKHLKFDVPENVHVGVELIEQSCPVCGRPMIGEGFNIDLLFCYYWRCYWLEYIFPFDKYIEARETFRKSGCSLEIEEEGDAFIIRFPNLVELHLMSTRMAKRLSKGWSGMWSERGGNWLHPLAPQMADQLSRLADLTGVRPGQIPIDNSFEQSGFMKAPFQNVLFSGLDNQSGSYTEKVQMALSQGKAFAGIHSLMERDTEKVLSIFKLNGFYDLVRLFGIYHGGGMEWFGDGEQLLKDGDITQQDLPTCREEVYEYLGKIGFDRKTAFFYANRIRKGKGLLAEQEEALRVHGAPEWFITSCNKNKYLPSRTTAIFYALIAWRLLHYKLCVNLGAFYQAYLDTVDINMELCMSIAKGEIDLDSTLESIMQNERASYRNDVFTLRVVKEMMEQGFSFWGYLRRAITFRGRENN